MERVSVHSLPLPLVHSCDLFLNPAGLGMEGGALCLCPGSFSVSGTSFVPVSQGWGLLSGLSTPQPEEMAHCLNRVVSCPRTPEKECFVLFSILFLR